MWLDLTLNDDTVISVNMDQIVSFKRSGTGTVLYTAGTGDTINVREAPDIIAARLRNQLDQRR